MQRKGNRPSKVNLLQTLHITATWKRFKRQSEFEFASKTGDKKLIASAAQRVADIKEQERVRTSNLHGYAERLVNTDPQDD